VLLVAERDAELQEVIRRLQTEQAAALQTAKQQVSSVAPVTVAELLGWMSCAHNATCTLLVCIKYSHHSLVSLAVLPVTWCCIGSRKVWHTRSD
jgi:hypothetical protein